MKRIEGFDFARALAILGMMLVNYKIVFTYGRIKYPILTRIVEALEGRAAAVFLILAGIGMGLMTKKSYDNQVKEQKNTQRVSLFKRAIFLFVLGMILYRVFDWSADILHYYGVYMILVLIFIYQKPDRLIKSILGVLLVSLLLQLVLDYSQGWDPTYNIYKNFFTLEGFSRHLLFNGYHPVFPWFAFILLGLYLSRKEFTQSTYKAWIIIGGSVALGLELISYLLIRTMPSSETMVYLLDTKPMNPSILYMFAASVWAIFFIGISLFISSKYENSKLIKAISATGKMALSHYVIHSIFILGIFETIDQLTYRDEIFVLILSFVVFIVMILFSNLWLKYFKRGPLELVMRRLS